MRLKNINKELIAPHVSSLIDTFVPQHVRLGNPKFVRFVEKYLEFLETTHGSGYFQNTLYNQRDIELQEEQFLKQIENELGLFVPREFAATPRVFYNKLTDLWKSKGSEESIKTFFRLFLNDPVEIRYPWDKVLKPSDGRWIIETKLRVAIIRGMPEDFLGKQIEQLETIGLGRVEKIEQRAYASDILYELYLVRGETVGTFFPRNQIRSTDNLALAEIYNSVVNLNILNGGIGYARGDKITLDRFEGTTFIAFVSEIDEDGSIVSITMSDFGAGNTPSFILDDQNNRGRPFYLEDFVLFNYPSRTVATGLQPKFTVTTENGEGAEFEMVYGSTAVTDGIYDGNRGQLSSSIVLQDSKFYQKFSYEIITQNPINIWKGALKKTVHPAGSEVFSNVRIFNKLNLAAQGFAFSEFVAPPLYTLGENVVLEETVKAFTQNYSDLTDGGGYFFEDYTGTIHSDFTTTTSRSPLLPPELIELP